MPPQAPGVAAATVSSTASPTAASASGADTASSAWSDRANWRPDYLPDPTILVRAESDCWYCTECRVVGAFRDGTPDGH
eukprot:1077920-Alexandrium_andersonii.AAC.1